MRYPLNDYAVTIAHRIDGGCDVSLTLRALQLAEAVGQFREFQGGCVAWLQSAWQSVPLFESKDIEGIASLTMRELTTGPVLYIAEILTTPPGPDGSMIYADLRTLPGLEACCAHIAFGDRRGWALEPLVDLREAA